MLPLRVQQSVQRIDALIGILDSSVWDVDPQIQNVFANHVVLAASGHIETVIMVTLSEYGKQHGNPKISRFVEKTVSRNNALNCEKIEKLLHQFDKDWWKQITDRTAPENLAAVDSLKTLRDQIAHGKSNGTGYSVVIGYYQRVKSFTSDFVAIVG